MISKANFFSHPFFPGYNDIQRTGDRIPIEEEMMKNKKQGPPPLPERGRITQYQCNDAGLDVPQSDRNRVVFGSSSSTVKSRFNGPPVLIKSVTTVKIRFKVQNLVTKMEYHIKS